MTVQSQNQTIYDPDVNETFVVNNAGQREIYSIRRAFRLGSLAFSKNPSPEIQAMLNSPVQINTQDVAILTEDKDFLANLIGKIEKNEIKLFTPATLLNSSVYESLNQTAKSKADFDVLNLLNRIREIKKLWDIGDRNSYQLLSLVRHLRNIKERIESISGDIFVI